MGHSAPPPLLLKLALVWSAPLWWAVKRSDNREVLSADIERWIECIGNEQLVPLSERQRFAYLAGALPEFRNLVHLRSSDIAFPISLAMRRLYRGLSDLVIEAGSIGPGFFIHHGYGTIVVANSIGANFWVNQHATVGHSGRGIPTIGNNVSVASGALVVGPIELGDGCVIGGNSVITRDVAAGVTMIPAPPVELTRRAPDPSAD